MSRLGLMLGGALLLILLKVFFYFANSLKSKYFFLQATSTNACLCLLIRNYKVAADVRTVSLANEILSACECWWHEVNNKCNIRINLEKLSSRIILRPGGFDWQETPVIKDCNDKMDRLQPLLDFHVAFWKRRQTDRQMGGKWKQRVPWYSKWKQWIL